MIIGPKQRYQPINSVRKGPALKLTQKQTESLTTLGPKALNYLNPTQTS